MVTDEYSTTTTVLAYEWREYAVPGALASRDASEFSVGDDDNRGADCRCRGFVGNPSEADRIPYTKCR